LQERCRKANAKANETFVYLQQDLLFSKRLLVTFFLSGRTAQNVYWVVGLRSELIRYLVLIGLPRVVRRFMSCMIYVGGGDATGVLDRSMAKCLKKATV
jgi:hypothetical protein